MRARLMMGVLALSLLTAHAQFAPQDADAKYATDLLPKGTVAPDFKIKDINGKNQKLSKLVKGKYLQDDSYGNF